MPVPQENLSFVERARCPFLTMVQDVSLNYEQARCLFHKKIYLLWNGHLARS
ncbi:hypothetical protein [Microcoleus sp.]|uniref:hypothetical protein n=1 Tax=Microcoleus sp. TaxID=44472 RepID=UPI00403ECBD3